MVDHGILHPSKSNVCQTVIKHKLTPYEFPHNCVREDRTVGRYGMRAQKAETQDHNQQEVYPPARKFRMWSYSTRRLNSDTSRITLCSLNLPRINSTVAQESRGNHLPSLLRTQVRGTCRLGSLLHFFFLHKRVRSSAVSWFPYSRACPRY